MCNHHFSNFGRPPIPDDLCKDSATRHPWFWRSRILKVFTTYGYGRHFGQWTATILAIFHSPAPGRLQINLSNTGPGAPEEKVFEILNIFSIHMQREANNLSIKCQCMTIILAIFVDSPSPMIYSNQP